MKSVEKSIEALKALQDPLDPEYAHLKADKILCDLLIELGHQDVVAEWEKVDKWYS